MFDQMSPEHSKEKVKVRLFTRKELDWAYGALAWMRPQVAATSFLMLYPEFCQCDTGEILEKSVVKDVIRSRFYDLKHRKGRKAYREIRKRVEEIRAFREKHYSYFPAFLDNISYMAKLLDMAERAKTDMERSRYYKAIRKVGRR